MREMLSVTASIVGMGLSDSVALVTTGDSPDRPGGRAWGISSRGPGGRSYCPGSRRGQDRIDIPNRSLEILVSPEELEKRRQTWSPPP